MLLSHEVCRQILRPYLACVHPCFLWVPSLKRNFCPLWSHFHYHFSFILHVLYSFLSLPRVPPSSTFRLFHHLLYHFPSRGILWLIHRNPVYCCELWAVFRYISPRANLPRLTRARHFPSDSSSCELLSEFCRKFVAVHNMTHEKDRKYIQRIEREYINGCRRSIGYRCARYAGTLK